MAYSNERVVEGAVTVRTSLKPVQVPQVVAEDNLMATWYVSCSRDAIDIINEKSTMKSQAAACQSSFSSGCCC